MKRKDLVRGILSVMAAVLLASCGGGSGGGDNNPPPATQPPSGLQYPAHSAYVIQQAVTPLTPTVTGQVTSYSISPSLPTGLAFSATTGVISGTPTVIAASATYTVTATNDGGSTTTTVSIEVDTPPASVAYSPYYAFTANVPTQDIKPTVHGIALTNWSVNPALPAGLTLSSTDGTISGIPTAGSVPTVYAVTARYSGGSLTANLTIAVAAAPLLDVGHGTSILLLRATATRLLSFDIAYHWVLQDYTSGATIAQGYACTVGTYYCLSGTSPYFGLDIEGNLMLDPLQDGVEVRSADDGHLLSKHTGAAGWWWRLASDGSYLAGGNPTMLMVWSPSGEVLVSKSGNYGDNVRVFAAPGQLLVAQGAAGQNVIETISVPTGTSSLSPVFQGRFDSWFTDGARFLTVEDHTLRTYSSAAVQQDVAPLPDPIPLLYGTGNYVSSFDPSSSSGMLYIYPVGATSAPPVFTGTYSNNTASFDNVYPKALGNTLVVFPFGTAQIVTIDLSGTTPTSTTVSLPVSRPSAYVPIPGGAWVAGNNLGVIVDGASLASSQPRFLALGRAWSIAGGSNYFSVATAAGKIFNYESSTNALVSTINFPSTQLAASSSGAVLAAVEDSENKSSGLTLNVYSLPSGTVTASLPYDPTPPFRIPLALSAAGDVLLAPLVNTSGCKLEAINLASSSQLWCGTAEASGTVALSPDGTLVAAQVTPAPNASTKIYKNGALAATVAGEGIGWFDNNRLLANKYRPAPEGLVTYDGAVIYDSLGNVLGASPLPAIGVGFDVVTSDSIFVSGGGPSSGAIYSLTDGANLWSSQNLLPGGTSGVVSGSQVVFGWADLVLAQPH